MQEIVRYALTPAYCQTIMVREGSSFLKVLGVKNTYESTDVILYMLEDTAKPIQQESLVIYSAPEQSALPSTVFPLQYLDAIQIEDGTGIPLVMHLFMETASGE